MQAKIPFGAICSVIFNLTYYNIIGDFVALNNIQLKIHYLPF